MKTTALLFTLGGLLVSPSAYSKGFCGAYKSDPPCHDVDEGSECATSLGKFGACTADKYYGDEASCKCVGRSYRVVEYGKDGPKESGKNCNTSDSDDGCKGVSLNTNCIVEGGEGICVPSKQNLSDTTCVCVEKPEEKVISTPDPAPEKPPKKP